MRTDQLARVDWQMGQTLLPAHLIAMEDACISDTALRFSLLGRPFYGVGRLKWNDSLLAEGIVSIVSMSVIMPSGLVIDIPGNTSASTFNLNLAGSTRVPVYLHLVSERASVGANNRKPQERDSLDRVVQKVALTSEQTNREALQTMKLAEFEKDPEGVWGLAPDWLPPLLQVGTSPFLVGALDNLGKLVELFHEQLQEDIAASYLGGEGLFSAKQCLRAVYAIRRFLANLKGDIHAHPYHLWEALKSFYIEVCLYKGATPEHIDAPYAHDDLATALKKVMEPLIEQIQVSRGKTPYLPFQKQAGLYVADPLPTEVRVAKEIYFLVQKSRVSEVVSMEGVKLASRARLPIVHSLALQGIPLRKIDRPPFQHGFGSEVEFFLLREGEEWDHALREGAVAFFDTPALANAKAYLYWRTT